MENIKIYIESGSVHIQSGSSAITGLNTSLSTANSPAVYPANGELTASVVNTNNIKVVNSESRIILNNVPFGNLKEKNGTTSIGASATAVRDNLNGTHYFGSSTLETKLGTETAKITALENATKTSTNDRGIYINDAKGTTQGHLQITDTVANLQAGATTKVALTDVSTGQGSISLAVRAGSNGQQTSVTALSIAGDSSFNNALVTFGEPVTFSNSVSGLSSAAIPNLATSKITSGTFTATRIPSLNASKIGSGTLADARVAASNVTQHQASLSISESQISDLSHYTDASVNTHLNQSSATSGQYLKWTGTDYAWGTVSSGGLGNVVEDTTPQLGGDLDVSGNKITSSSNGDVVIDPAGTGAILLKSDNIKFEGAGTVTMSSLKFYEATALDGNYVAFKAPLSIANDVTWILPAADGTANQVIKTDGSGTLSFTTVVSSVNPSMQGTASIQAVGGLSAGLKIFDDDTSHGIRLLAPDLTADVDFTLPATDGSSGQVLKTDGSGNLSFVAQTADTNTNLGNTDMTLSGSRIVTMGHDLNFKVGSTSKLLYDVSANSGNGKWQFNAPTQFLNDVTFNGTGGTTQASIKFNEPSMGGTSGVILQGPSTNMASDLTFTLPDTDGTSGQVLQTDGSGNLSFATVSGGGGASETWLADMGGLYTWSSSDSGETVAMNLSYGEFFYSHSTELSQTGLRNYSSSATINTTTATVDNYKLQMVGFPVHTTNKKVRCDYNFRVQSAPLNSTWGISIWGGTLSASGTASGERTMTLRGRAADITANPNTSTVVHHGSFTTTSTINGGFILPLVESRTGTLTTTTRIYGRFRFFLVD